VQVRRAIQTRHMLLLIPVKLLLVQTLSPFFERFFIFSGPKGTRQKNSKFGLNESPAQNENYGGLFRIYTVLVIDYCASETVKISPPCKALTISP
jgi:hypothetical protein